jgi:hypothetical protein
MTQVHDICAAPAGGPACLPLLVHHPVNGALVLIASRVLLAKIERRRAHVRATKGANR